jgi:hypothetical protein
MTCSAILRRVTRNIHFAATAILLVALFPLLSRFRLPFKFDWGYLLGAYWGALAIRSIFLASCLWIVEVGLRESVQPMGRRYRNDKRRLLILFPLLLVLFALNDAATFVRFSIAALALFELADRSREKPGLVTNAAKAILLPALYLFLGLVLVSCLNDMTMRVRYYCAYDGLFNRADAWLLGGLTVPGIAHFAAHVLPAPVFKFLEFVYFEMMDQVGAALILLGFLGGKARAFRFAGTLLTAYYVSVLVFVFWPSQGPYSLASAHLGAVHPHLKVYLVQQSLLEKAKWIWLGGPIEKIAFEYYIAFPSMHTALMMIVLWFLRDRRRMVVVLLGFDLIIFMAMILLEWHYVVDVFAGAVVAVLSILMVGDCKAISRESAPADLPRGGSV